jgi:hypothetical protein
MKIRFTRREEDDHIIHCTREDGSITWMHISSFFVIHDLCHYALETQLHLKRAFFGMLASGTDISEFEKPKNERNIILTGEAILAEHIVNLLAIESDQGKIENWKDQLRSSLSGEQENEIPEDLTESMMEKIRNARNELLEKWKELEKGDTLNLLFN